VKVFFANHRSLPVDREASADYSERMGTFVGSAINKTREVPTTGKVSLEIFKIENSGRSVSARFEFSEGLYSKGTLVGAIDEDRLQLVGIISSISSGGSFDCRLRAHPQINESQLIHAEIIYPQGVSDGGRLM